VPFRIFSVEVFITRAAPHTPTRSTRSTTTTTMTTTTMTTTTSRALLARYPARRALPGAGARRPWLRAQSSGRDVADAFGALAASVHGDDDGDGVVFDDHAILEAANAVESPLFNDAFRDALRDANARMSEEKREEKEKIDREVQEIMARVREERAARAGVSAGAAVPAAAVPAAAVATAAVATAAAAPTPAPTPTPTPTPEALDAADEFSNMLRDELMEMKKSSEKTLNSLAQARDRLVEAIAREERKLGRTEMLLNTVQREARYRRADRAAAARKQQK
jgi:hypothetical protein